MCIGETLVYDPATPAEVSPQEEQSPPSAELNPEESARVPQEADDFDALFDGLLSAAARAQDPDSRSEATTEVAGDVQALLRGVPVLKVGSKLTSELRLKAHRWVNIGRDPKSQLLVDCSGVSREHCALRWDPHQRRVELKDMSVHGTFVNDKHTKHEVRVLHHADRISINGKGKTYTFVLDLRAVGLGFSDPCTHLLIAKSAQATALARADKRRAVEALKAQLEEAVAAEKVIDARTFEKEKEYYEIIARLQMRQQADEVRRMELEQLREDTKMLGVKLRTSRKEWYKKLKSDQKRTSQQVGPVIQLVADLQMQLERMNLKRAEMERHIYPHKFGFIDSGGLMRLDRCAPSSPAAGNQVSGSSPKFMNSGTASPIGSGSGHAPSSPASVVYRNTDSSGMPPPSSPSSNGATKTKRGRSSPNSGDQATSPPIKDGTEGTPDSDEKLENMMADTLVELHKMDEDAYILGRELFGDFDSEEEQQEEDDAEAFWADFDSNDEGPMAKRAKLNN